MGLFFLTICIVYLASSPQLLCAARDRLAVGESISVNQTIVSAGKIFELGFFNLGNSTANRYAGIWYNQIPGRTVVWVANREKPLRDPAGVLTVTEDGNIAVLDGEGSTLWATNLPGVAPSNDTTAVLHDSGNLVLRHGAHADLWQSFDHPTDTLLPNMKVRPNFNTGSRASPILISWKDVTDPSPGEFVLTIDPRSPLQACIMKGSDIYWRRAPWNGIPQIAREEKADETVEADDQGIYWTFNVTDSSLLARYALDQTGRLSFFQWDDRSQKWTLKDSTPTEPCDFYSRCGPYGSCFATEHSPRSLCQCLDGFRPRNLREWDAGNFTGGCVRRIPLQCDGTDTFVKFTGMKLPDQYSLKWNISATQCEAECSASCRCQGYAHANFSISNASGSRCLIWPGEMTDLAQASILSGDLYVRLSSPAPEGNSSLLLDNGSPSNSRKKERLIKIVLPILSVGLLLLGTLFYLFMKRLKSREVGKNLLLLEDLNFFEAPGSRDDLSDVPLFHLKSVKAATSSFSSANKLGEGGFGPVYKGKLLSGHEIAVKRLSKGSEQGYQEFANEVRLIAKLQHKNLVRLLGWCTHQDEKILIYEYMPNKSLDKFIFDPTRSAKLNWEKRFRIVEGIANGLLYLHQHSRMRVIHRDLKTSNILLDSEMNPKISDFGLARIFSINQTQANTKKIVGTYGYMSPEYAMRGIFSEKSDVFSFGVILLEIITGKRSTVLYPYGDSHNLLGYAWRMWEEGRGLELQDPSMGSPSPATDALKCIQLALLCIQEDAADRPTMSSIISLMSNETCTLPTPKQPAFAIGRDPNPIILFSCDRPSNASINQLTRSSIEGR